MARKNAKGDYRMIQKNSPRKKKAAKKKAAKKKASRKKTARKKPAKKRAVVKKAARKPARKKASRKKTKVRKNKCRKTYNPATLTAAEEKARQMFVKFHWGDAADHITQETIVVPEALVKLGDVTSLRYLTEKGRVGEAEFVHDFDMPLPVLASDPTGKQLFIVGGSYTVTRAGIEG